jgi:hypothetical protein
VEQLARDAREHGLVILAGAAVSMPPPSSLPGWTQLNTAFLEALAVLVGENTEFEVDGSFVGFLLQRRDETGHIPPEFQAQLAEDECDVDYFRVLQSLDIETWNACHGSIARLAESGVLRALVTTNFDRLGELAIAATGVEPRVFCDMHDFEQLEAFLEEPGGACPVIKVHGTVDRPETMVDTLRQRVVGRPEALERALATIFRRHAVLVAGFSGADLAYDPEYLGLRAGAAESPAFVVLNRFGTEPLDAMAELVTAVPHARFVDGELPWDLESLAGRLASDLDAPRPAWDSEMEWPGIRPHTMGVRAYEWAESVGWLQAANIMATVCEAAGSMDAATRLLTIVGGRALGKFKPDDPAYARHLALSGRNLVDQGALRRMQTGEGVLAVGLLTVAADRGGRLDALGELARAHAYLGYTSDALARAREVGERLPGEPRAGVQIDSLLAVLPVYALVGDATVGLQVGHAALALATGAGDEPRRARACLHLSRALVSVERCDEAETLVEDGLSVARRLGLEFVTAQLHTAYARIELVRDRPEEALKHVSPACALFRDSRLELHLAEGLLLLFEAGQRTGDVELATIAMDALDPLVQRLPGLIPHYFATRATARLRSEQLDAARDEIARLRAAAEELENPWGLAAADSLAQAL